MDKTKFINLIKGVKSVYPNFGVKSPEQVEFWYTMLKDIPYETLSVAVKKHISQNKWPPTIADLREQASETREELPSASDAWGEVQRAIRHYGSYREQEALESLPPIIRRTVKGLNYKSLCLSENEMADRAHFFKTYNAMAEREKKDSMLSTDVKLAIEGNRQRTDQVIGKLLEGKSIGGK